MTKKEFIVEVDSIEDGDILIWQPPKDLFPPIPVKDELIRCKDCRYCDNLGKSKALKCTNWYIDVDPHPDFYCAYGVRKEE